MHPPRPDARGERPPAPARTASTTSSQRRSCAPCRRRTPGAGRRGAQAWAEGLAHAGELGRALPGRLDFEQYRFPGFPVPPGRRAFSVARDAVPRGCAAALPPADAAVVKQLAHELEVIERTGLAEFFLICWDLMQFCRERGIPAQGRGSAGDSIVAYVLGITRVDPIRHKLLFERFINEGRDVVPGRGHRLRLVAARGGHPVRLRALRRRSTPGMVCNVVTYRARSAVREVGYALGFPRPLVDRVAKALETYDSVMVRRDLEAEGGFAEFFQGHGATPGKGAAGEGPP